jgi:hypothetical protein
MRRYRFLFWMGVAANALAAPPEARYTGSKTCYGCHAEIYRSFAKTDMARSMRTASELDKASVPREAMVAVPGTNRRLRVVGDRTGWRQSESEPNLFDDEHRLDYIVGSGSNGLTFLIRRGNYLFEAPLSYYSKPNKWDLSPGYEFADYGFSRQAPEGCILCHSGRAQPVLDHPGAYRDPPFQELAIGCENCHGPGQAHAQDPKRRGNIVNPAKLSPRLAENICMSCHQTGDARVLQPGKTYQDFRPGQWLFDTVAILKVPPDSEERHEQDLLEHNAAMQASRCFTQSGGKLSCLTCHDPHVQPLGAEASTYFKAKCLTCHTERSCKLSLAARQSRADNCIGCHMPKRSVAVISHSALTNHRVPARPDQPLPPWKPTAASDLVIVNPIVNQPEGRSSQLSDIALLRAYNDLVSRSPEYQSRYLALLDKLGHSEGDNPYVQAALAHQALAEGKNEEALVHLATGVRLGEAAVYEDMAIALANLGRDDEAIPAFLKGIDIDPYRTESRKRLILEYVKLKHYTEARHAMEEYVGLFPGDTFMRSLLARVSN